MFRNHAEAACERLTNCEGFAATLLRNCPGAVPVAGREAGMSAEENTPEVWGRRSGEDRRKQQVPIDFPDRRKGERRSGKDRRAHPRS